MHSVIVKGILSSKNGMNLYRGCTHGCIYCDSRSTCYGMDHDFEDVAVKSNALDLLEKALKSKRNCCMIGTGSMSDPYQPLEEDARLTRKSLEIIYRYGFGVSVLTKSDFVLRDLDLLAAINQKSKAVVQMTVTTFDDALCMKLEPNVSPTSKRFSALKKLIERGVPTIVWLSPILPEINDTPENIGAILDTCGEIGVKGVLCFGMGVTMREGNREYFYQQLDRLFPGMRREYVQKYGLQYEWVSDRNTELMTLFHQKCSRYGMMDRVDEIFDYLNEFPVKNEQLTFF